METRGLTATRGLRALPPAPSAMPPSLRYSDFANADNLLIMRTLIICSAFVAWSCCSAAAQNCAAARRDYANAVGVLYHPEPGRHGPAPTPRSISDRADLIERQLNREIVDQLRAGAPSSAASRLRAWLVCVQKGYVPHSSTDAPLVLALGTNSNAVLVAEWIPLYWPQVRTYVQIWNHNGKDWKPSEWRNPIFQNAYYWLRPVRSPAPEESWFVEWGYTVGNGDFLLHLDVLAWDGHNFRQVWSAPGSGVYQSFVESVSSGVVTIRSVFGIHGGPYRELLRTLTVSKRGLMETDASFLYPRGRPRNAPLKPEHLVPLTEPGPRGFPRASVSPDPAQG
jgi:hypothetical protein